MRLERITALRGVAAVIVVLYHVRQIALRDLGGAYGFGWFGFGHAGVDLFFVLSGFIIYHVHAGDIGHAARVAPFAEKRLARVYPIYWLVTLVVLLLAALAPGSMSAAKFSPAFIVKSLTLWPIDGRLPIIPPAWTLSHEIKFYAVFALAIALRRALFLPLLAALLAGTAVMYVAYLQMPAGLPRPVGNFYVDFLFSPYNLHFAAGVLLGYLLAARRVRWGRAALLAGVALFAAAAWGDVTGSLRLAYLIPSYGLASVLVVGGLAALDLDTPRAAGPLLRVLGEASYSIYLVHLAVIVVCARLILRLGPLSAQQISAALVLTAVVSVLAGIVLHRLVERPLLRYSRRRAPGGRAAQSTVAAEVRARAT